MGSIAARRLVNDGDIAELRKLLSATNAVVSTQADPGYEQSIERWSKAAEKHAGVAIVPTTSEEVAIAVKYASDHDIELAVKGGGHSTSGASSTEGGILIDLGGMQHVEVDTANNQLHIQGGAVWAQSDAAAWKHKLATVGGTVGDTGVGGLTLGGGYGHLSGVYGLTIDNTVGFTVVLPSGKIENVTKKSNPDLFWAMNGAGQNFGVTTEFVLQAYPQEEMYMGTLIFDPSPENLKRLTAVTNDILAVQDGPSGPATNAKGRLGSLMGFVKPPPMGGATALLMILVFNGTEEEGKKLLQPIFDIGPLMNDMSMREYPECNKLAPAIAGMRSSMKGSSFTLPIREEFFVEIKDKFEEFTAGCEDAKDTVIAFELYDPCKVAALDNGCFANRGHHLNSLIMPLWNQKENDQQCRQFARDVSEMFKKELELQGNASSNGVEGGAGIRGKKGAVMLYGNYDQYEEKSRDLFGENYQRLQALKAQYDPKNLFNKLFAIAPA